MQKTAKKATAVSLAIIMMFLITGFAPHTVQAAAEPFADTRARTLEMIEMIQEAVPFAGLTIALVDVNQDYTWFHNVGYADVAGGVPVTEFTLFNVGSTAKVFTAMAVMQLVEDGLLDLDEPIVTYLPGFGMRPHPSHGGNSNNITARMLLTHTSGIHEFTGDTAFSPAGQDPTFLNRLLPMLNELHLQNTQLNRVTYNNTAFGVLGILVASLTGHTHYFNGFVEYTRGNLFAPAGMTDTDFGINASNRARIAGVYMDATTPMPAFNYVSITPAGGAVSNAVDMAQFLRVLLTGGGDVLSTETLDYMTAVQDMGIRVPNTFDMGLGFMHIDALGDGVAQLGHGGNLLHHTELLLDKENGFGVFISTNSMTGPHFVHGLAQQMMRWVYEEINGTAPQPNVTVVTRTPLDVPATTLAGWYSGQANIFPGPREVVACDEGNLHILDFPGIPAPITLTPVGDGVFTSDMMPGAIWFYEIDGIVFMFQGNVAIAERVQLRPATPGSAERWAGAWQLFEGPPDIMGMEVTVGVDERNLLYVEMMGIRTFISSEDVYTSYSPGRMRTLGSVSEAIWDGTEYIMRESGLYLRRVVEAEATTLPLDTTVYRFVIGENHFTRNGEVFSLAVAPFLYNGRSMISLQDAVAVFDWPLGLFLMNEPVALRTIAETLNGSITWDRVNRVVYIVL